ncbi:MAG TPA: trehalose-phosphatase [Candidatus Bathyarchaeia archaeon]|nr:trehalose-phosphatase [Candidatus Bathyarchaeia archaeon]
MRILNDRFEVEGLLRAVRRARNRVLFLDYDGTLAPFIVDRSEAAPYPGVLPLLSDLGALIRHRLVFVSGRPAKDLARLLPLSPRPTIWGSHGMEELDADGKLRTGTVPPEAQRVLDAEALRLEAALGGGHVERKPVGLAVHVRGLATPQGAEILDAVRGPWKRLVERHPLTILEFDGGIELCAGMRRKGDVVQRIVRELEPPYAAAFLGDDVTDEDAFRAMRGRGASILVRPELRPTVADLWLTPPAELLAFLERWRDAASGAPA